MTFSACLVTGRGGAMLIDAGAGRARRRGGGSRPRDGI